MRLKEKVAIITGGASGIGLAACERFLEEGAKVVLADFNEMEANNQIEKIREKGNEIDFIQVDVSDEDSVCRLVKETKKKYGKIDVLINNAGITDDATLVKMNIDQFHRVLDVNVKGVFLCTQAVAPTMIEQGKGKIINTSSVSGVYGNFGQTNYAASKAAVIGMTKTWAKELGRKGINVNAVAPGFTLTAMVKKMPEEIIEKMKGNVALQTLGKPRDIANAYLFLASEEANYVHGHVLHVDGGIMM
ncbi:3-oxoacyl-ACP reductase FabG [Pseudogracilibacillus auburnensis]|uniref:3-oxoacyl-[acyl-carrier-protein] reductase n=1 Tax=Pseudogracilibacillus auburnensis TaxID=1494959 RepID=A0A2V3WNM9_9BACI|nr:3-oxoacyl-ACP reductase FabG [Pseudogracilibacillus auburnensis]MBO1003680.1 3-oxoacyl-ACP reductase FabG [Pseudogracilibacillus auburnensis]PXW90309.1 3-oxoacyl-[acyl-carrier-protein] reductase [Pseudogracilibacillus auburnensis]